jgi:hypothetical protein
VYELFDLGAQFVQVREGAPVVVLVFEDAPDRFRGRVVPARLRLAHGPYVPLEATW